MNTEPLDYFGRKGLQEFQRKAAEIPQQSESIKRQPAGQLKAEQSRQDEMPLTRSEVQGLINSLVESIVKGFAQKSDINSLARGFEIAKQELKRSVPTKKQITDWAIECVPPSLRGLDSDPTRKLGDTLKLVSGYPVGSDKAGWMPDIGGGFEVEGDQALYKGVFLREYDADGVIVSPGSEIGTEGTGHTLKPTWDYMRFI